jgi:phage-related protein
MAYEVFPTITKLDSETFAQSSKDMSHRKEMSSGAEYTRRKHTGAPKKGFSYSYPQMSAAEKLLLDTFYDNHAGGEPFYWTHPLTNVQHLVRFAEGGMTFKYVGIGKTELWSADVSIKEV